MTLKQFITTLNAQRKSEIPPKHPLKFPLTKRKVLKKRVERHELSENGIPRIVVVEPVKTAVVTDTNSITRLYQAMFKFFLGNELKRISSEGSWRPSIGFIPNTNKGFADLHGIYNGQSIYIEVKQAKEKQLQSQINFQQWVEQGGGLYKTIRSFDEMWELLCTLNPSLKDMYMKE